ncbi:hypothetical protein TNCT_695011 [Trichonephila clavata]|uniref:Uncharacterized protein n=1 Tax=Trichonephila clavata TaxID=2740835 RepID=A0A8X6KX96_TRICU|nr:hypothetical protein TNCT_695011 [Trichonephila clavata]
MSKKLLRRLYGGILPGTSRWWGGNHGNQGFEDPLLYVVVNEQVNLDSSRISGCSFAVIPSNHCHHQSSDAVVLPASSINAITTILSQTVLFVV